MDGRLDGWIDRWMDVRICMNARTAKTDRGMVSAVTTDGHSNCSVRRSPKTCVEVHASVYSFVHARCVY